MSLIFFHVWPVILIQIGLSAWTCPAELWINFVNAAGGTR